MAAEALPNMWLPPLTEPWLVAYAIIITALLLILFARWWPRHKQQRAAREALIERDRRMRMALWGAGEAFWDYDLATHTLTATIYPSPKSDGARTLPFEVHPDDIDSAIAQLQQFLAAPNGRDLVLSNYRVRFTGHGHEWQRASARGRVVRWDAQDKPLLLSGTARNISRQIAAEQAQKVAVEVFQSMQEAVAILDADFNLISFNEALVRMTGHSHEALRNQPLRHLLQLTSGQDIDNLMRHSLDSSGHWEADLWQKHATGHETLCRVRASAIHKDAGTSPPEGAHYVLVLSDIVEQRLTHEELRLLAHHDPLTDLPNRTLLKRRLEEALHRRQAPAQLAVLYLDLDRFKDINDSLGHAIGDMVLQETGKRLRQIAPPTALVARSGGDEFAIIIEHIADESRATELARKILADFSTPLQLENGMEFNIAPSIGISLCPDDGHDADTLLRKADTAMYRAKNAGRNMFRRYHPGMDQQVVHRLQVVNLLRGATDRGEISLAYQPRYCLQCQRYCGVEALLRWHHPELGIVPPSEFIPLAEESGLIIELGHWVIEEACKTLAQWQAAGLDGIGMAINVSSMQLLREDFPDLVISHVRRHGIKPELLELEITESVFLDNPHLASDRLLALGGQGIRISIDDFGTGYSSLAYLRSLPINRIKIDRAFIASASHNPREEAIIIAIINMARAMQVEVVAEGVETREQLQMLQQHGCNEVQGFFLARPLPADACFALLQSGHAPLDPRPTA